MIDVTVEDHIQFAEETEELTKMNVTLNKLVWKSLMWESASDVKVVMAFKSQFVPMTEELIQIPVSLTVKDS